MTNSTLFTSLMFKLGIFFTYDCALLHRIFITLKTCMHSNVVIITKKINGSFKNPEKYTKCRGSHDVKVHLEVANG